MRAPQSAGAPHRQQPAHHGGSASGQPEPHHPDHEPPVPTYVPANEPARAGRRVVEVTPGASSGDCTDDIYIQLLNGAANHGAPLLCYARSENTRLLSTPEFLALAETRIDRINPPLPTDEELITLSRGTRPSATWSSAS